MNILTYIIGKIKLDDVTMTYVVFSVTSERSTTWFLAGVYTSVVMYSLPISTIKGQEESTR